MNFVKILEIENIKGDCWVKISLLGHFTLPYRMNMRRIKETTLW